MPGRARDDTAVLKSIRKAALVAPQGHHPAASLVRSVVDSIPSEAKFVLIGEASHGTDEFYRMRGDITRTLIAEQGFNAVAVEADFPDAFRANMWVRGLNHDKDAEEALSDFIRFPEWMWRNAAVRDFLTWLRKHNDGIPGSGAEAGKVGFYGVDVYSLHSSAARVVEYLKGVDKEAASRVQKRYQCFDRYGEDAHDYARATGLFHAPPCSDAAIGALREVLRTAASREATADGETGWEQQFAAECNAAVVSGAESYYRNLYFGDELTWNLRDTHFADTVARIEAHLTSRMERAGSGASPRDGAKLVIWAHNSHLGDASATDMGKMRGEINLGQVMRQRYGMDKVFNIGFSTHHGTVAAADEWDSPGQRKIVRPGMPGSYEALLHDVGFPAFALKLRGEEEEESEEMHELRAALMGPRLERAIGVIYRPRTERQSHYFYAELPQQFDLVIHIDRTRAVQPLRPAHPSWEEEHLAKEDLPETYPFAV